jgi:Flp pilus assembly protein TadG
MALMLGLFAPPLLLGTADVGTWVYSSIEISNASHAAAMYGMTSLTAAADTTGMTTIAQAEASDFGTNLTVTPTVYFACSAAEGGTQYTTQTAANAICPSGATNHNLEFIQVVVSGHVTPPLHCPGLPATFTQSSTSVMEVEE